MSSLIRAIEAVSGLGLGGLAYGLTEAQMFTTREQSAAVLASGRSNLKILHLSDLHLTPRQNRKIQWVSALADLDPDLVVVTGDFMGHKLGVSAIVEALGDLLNKPGVFVFGSNDYYAPEIKNPFTYFNSNRKIAPKGKRLPTDYLADVLTNAGWFNLNNAQTQLIIDGLPIHARGTNDAHINLDDYESVAGPFHPGTLALGVTHSPYSRVTNSFFQDGADIVLAGHTHGGQVCIPFYGALITNCDLPRSQAKGLSTITDGVRETLLHVSAGVGTSPFTPIRVACRPEATLLTLVSRSTS
ncbi:MAG: metallophosphoesterase [Actinobacteria bacterium]|uniref:Unannotated protein n=1 Tax=freshwater metagenome TaxID=449393 RepID=A0A6J5YYZ7_9ZZZZ|nr:metallophosphoesterase [Actinomycetota bacterium]